MTSMRAVLVALACLLCAAVPAQAAQSPLGGGAWSWFGDPRAVTASGKTYVGWVDIEGDIKVSSYDHASGERVTVVLQSRLNQDDHANPSLYVLPDGRLMVFYSRHVGPAMHYRVSSRPGDVRSWEPPQTLPANIPGNFGYTYPNPIRLADGTTYLFWRGGNYNPTFSTQTDGPTDWSAPRNLILMPNERPYVKYAASGGDTIHVAYTNAHPNEFGDVNIYYARVRAGRIEHANGGLIRQLAAAPIAPAEGDGVFNPSQPTWVHDVAADSQGRPVIVFASFPSAADHRYHYARWTGSAWEVREMTGAGGSFREDGGSPYYSGGLTLDHEDPSRVYLSRSVAPGSWQVEMWSTSNGGANWTSTVVSLPGQRNVRPVSPRGMLALFDNPLSVVWMRGGYPNYEEYKTTITGVSAAGNQPPVADAEPNVRSGPPDLAVTFHSLAQDPDGSITESRWDFGDGTSATGADVAHTYTVPGRYFPTLTVTDSAGARSTFVEEITVGLPAAPVTRTGGTDGSTVHGAVDPKNRQTEWYFEYGPTGRYGARTPTGSLPGADALRQVSAVLPGLVPGRLYHYRLVASNASGTTEGEDRVMVSGSQPASDAYHDAVLATPGLAAYWRLGELSGSASRDERGSFGGAFTGRFVLGHEGVVGRLGDTAASFDGLGGERVGPGPVLGANGTMEGWFRWRAGTAVMRDNTGPSRGWLLAFSSGGTLRYRVGGQGYDTGIPIEDVRDGAWHHLVATKAGPAARLYVDGVRVHEAGGAGPDPAAMPWHVMRNGSNPVFSDGEADEIALYTRALTPDEVRAHHDMARALAAGPLPPETPDPVADPPAAGTGLGGGVLRPGTPASRPAGRAFVRRGVLIVSGAPGRRNRLSARRRGRAWRVADAAAALRAGPGCRPLRPRIVSCRAAGVRRIQMYGGAGGDTLAVRGRTHALLVGGPGPDRLIGGRLTRFRGGPGVDRVLRRP
jgi:BNR repeat-containing family member/PKD domain/Concanavalin A-like lectin/glucanases superfamily